MSELPVNIRPVSTDHRTRELAFVRETSIKVRWPRRAGIAWEEWEAMHGPIVDRALEGTTTLVAESDGVLLAFLSHLPDKLSGKSTVLMLYVKAAYRGERIGLRLLARAFPGNVQAQGGVYVIGGPSLLACMPTAPWGRWCAHWGIEWLRARCP